MIEAKPKVQQLQRCSFYPKVAKVCEKWEEICNRIQVSRTNYSFLFRFTIELYGTYVRTLSFLSNTTPTLYLSSIDYP